MKTMITTMLVALLAFLVSGCGSKPKVEAPTKGSATQAAQGETTSGSTGGEDASVFGDQSQRFATVYFDFDRYNLRDDAKATLRQNANRLKQNQDLRVTIEGHCDERGTVEYNLALGERRAKSVRDYLASLGIKADRLSVVSFGKERPAVPGRDEDSWARNRRAEFVEK